MIMEENYLYKAFTGGLEFLINLHDISFVRFQKDLKYYENAPKDSEAGGTILILFRNGSTQEINIGKNAQSVFDDLMRHLCFLTRTPKMEISLNPMPNFSPNIHNIMRSPDGMVTQDKKADIDPTERKLNKSIQNLFCTRTVNALHSVDIEYLRDLMSWRKRDLMKIRNFGIGSWREIVQYLEEAGLWKYYSDFSRGIE